MFHRLFPRNLSFKLFGGNRRGLCMERFVFFNRSDICRPGCFAALPDNKAPFAAPAI